MSVENGIAIACITLGVPLSVYAFLAFIRKIGDIKKSRNAALGDSVDHNEWRFGSPERYIPDNAIKIDPLRYDPTIPSEE